jgi:alpha-amylase
LVEDLGFKGILTEGAKHVLGWKSPNYVYSNALKPNIKVLLKNFRLSDDIAFRFGDKTWGDFPLSTDKFVSWLNALPKEEPVVNLFMDYETFGEHQWAETGIFEFMRHLPEAIFTQSNFTFSTPSEVLAALPAIGSIHVPTPISWADEERDLTAWLGNDMQDEAFDRLYELEKKIRKVKDPELLRDWEYLQTSDHFYYICTKFFSDGSVHEYFSPYDTPYDAFINYMNVLSDFILRVDAHLKNSA